MLRCYSLNIQTCIPVLPQNVGISSSLPPASLLVNYSGYLRLLPLIT